MEVVLLFVAGFFGGLIYSVLNASAEADRYEREIIDQMYGVAKELEQIRLESRFNGCHNCKYFYRAMDQNYIHCAVHPCGRPDEICPDQDDMTFYK